MTEGKLETEIVEQVLRLRRQRSVENFSIAKELRMTEGKLETEIWVSLANS